MISADQISSLVKSFNWHTPSWDLFILLFWAGAAVFYSFSAGRGRVISLLVSLYITKLLVMEAPWLALALDQKLPGSLAGLQQLVSFLVIFLVLFIFLSRYAFRTSVDGRKITFLPFVFLFSLLQVGLLINTVLTYLSGSGREFSPLVSLLFLGHTASFVWLVLPLVFLIIMGRLVADATEV